MSHTPQRARRDALNQREAEVRDQVMTRDGGVCWICGTRDQPTLQHRRPRKAGGTAREMTAANGLVLHGSGTTGCHGTVENEGRHELFPAFTGPARIDGWAYLLGYLIRETTGDAAVEPRDVLAWHHADRAWYELTDGAVRTVRADVLAPPRDLLAHLDALLAPGRPPDRWRPVRAARASR